MNMPVPSASPHHHYPHPSTTANSTPLGRATAAEARDLTQIEKLHPSLEATAEIHSNIYIRLVQMRDRLRGLAAEKDGQGQVRPAPSGQLEQLRMKIEDNYSAAVTIQGVLTDLEELI